MDKRPTSAGGFPLEADCARVPLITFDQASVGKMVNKARETGKPFRVLHFAAAEDVTEQYVPTSVPMIHNPALGVRDLKGGN